MQPKLKENFCSGKVIKWNDFCGQNLRRRKGKLSLFEEDLRKETENFWTKPIVLKVYSRDSTRRNGGDLVITSGQDSLLNEDDALLNAGDISEGEVGIGGSLLPITVIRVRNSISFQTLILWWKKKLKKLLLSKELGVCWVKGVKNVGKEAQVFFFDKKPKLVLEINVDTRDSG